MAETVPDKFAAVTDPDLIKLGGVGFLVAHVNTPRFIGSVNLQKGSLRIVTSEDDLNQWCAERRVSGQNPQAPLFELCSQMIDWAKANQNTLSADAALWPPLPSDAFSGRAATEADLESGAAYFVLEGGSPIDLPVPQYAYAFEKETNDPIPVIILQAEEEPRGDKVVAYIDLIAKVKHVAQLDGFILLGQDTPTHRLFELATPSYEAASKAMRELSGVVSCEGSVLDKRSFLKANQSVINSILADGFKHCSALEAFTLVDVVKSLVSRELALKKRALAAGVPTPDVMRHGINVSNTYALMERDPEVCVLSLYQSPESEFHGFLVWMDRGEIMVDRFPIATALAGRETASALRKLLQIKMWKDRAETEGILSPLLELFGSTVIPRVKKLEGTRKLVLVPHRWTHILPLHLMHCQSGGEVVYIDDVVSATTYAPSLTSFQWSFKSSLASVGPSRARTALVCVDEKNLGPGASFELRAYKNMFADTKGVDIVTKSKEIPRDLSMYPLLLWSSHGISDPGKWERSCIIFESEVFTAARIVKEWDLRTTFVSILAACETGIDLSADEELDEYFGLDMALMVAGSSTVVSTMWRVGDMVAGYSAVQLLEGLFQRQSTSSHLRLLRYLLRSGKWRDMVEMAYDVAKKDRSATKERYTARLEGLEQLMASPTDAFSHASQWGAFRNFGEW